MEGKENNLNLNRNINGWTRGSQNESAKHADVTSDSFSLESFVLPALPGE
jgi:hypothetical protein